MCCPLHEILFFSSSSYSSDTPTQDKVLCSPLLSLAFSIMCTVSRKELTLYYLEDPKSVAYRGGGVNQVLPPPWTFQEVVTPFPLPLNIVVWKRMKETSDHETQGNEENRLRSFRYTVTGRCFRPTVIRFRWYAAKTLPRKSNAKYRAFVSKAIPWPPCLFHSCLDYYVLSVCVCARTRASDVD